LLKAEKAELLAAIITATSHARFGEVGCSRRVALAQVVPPGESKAAHVESEMDL
jgi:hypothetical protein